LAASNIAKRVAMELGERVGHRVGYHVGMESRASPETRIMFMTTGIFLMRLVNNPDSLQKYTHIIMDEVHERDLDIDFSLVVIKHLLAGMETSGLNFKLVLMSATFNTDLFANYFSKTSIANVERVQVYEGVEEQYRKEEEERNIKLQRDWGRAEANAWDKLAKSKESPKSGDDDCGDMDDEDEWVEEKEDHARANPVKKASDPADIIEINARPFKVTEFYIDQIIKNIKSQREQLGLTAQDKELIHEAYESFHSNKPSIKEGVMRVASILICDIVER
jgi:HrpA-like RNA helicase